MSCDIWIAHESAIMARFENYINDISSLPERLRFQAIRRLVNVFCFIHVVLLDKLTIMLKQLKNK